MRSKVVIFKEIQPVEPGEASVRAKLGRGGGGILVLGVTNT